ncbi:hypothetical protein [Seleniivibrio woodruffii]|uniref:hypothetical protein n=1 Tax=Seleniivibrio woodruffii TaxID=1078050 RepID=UPI0026F27D2D|nr:hypothetical protein [Seleniivibrio woodruffii]
MTLRSVKFLIFIFILTAVTAAQVIFLAAFRSPSAGDTAVRSAFVRLAGVSEPVLFCEYKRSSAPYAPAAFNADIRTAVYGR